MSQREVVEWITVHGKHVPLFEGDSKADAVKRIIDRGPKVKQSERKHITDEEEIKARQIARNQMERERLNQFESVKADEGTQTEHRNIIHELDDDKKYDDGTYDIKTREPRVKDDGYQVTFCQIGDKYSDAEYAAKVNECLRMSADGKTYAGKYEGSPEISFYVKSRKLAYAYAEANNQISIWDWKNKDVIFTNGTGRRK